MNKAFATPWEVCFNGVQVDLLMQTRKSICLVEVKRQKEIGRDVIAEMEEKVRLVPRRRGR